MNKVERVIRGIFNWLKFSLSLRKIFGGNSPELVLKIIKLYVALEAPLYKDTLYFGRNMITSSKLLESLIDSYFETKSEVTLKQVMTVLKNEIIEREQKDGRKQLSGGPIRRSYS